MLRSVCAAAVLLMVCVNAAHGDLPPNFQNVLLLEGLPQVTGIEFLPDGRALLLERTGAIRIVDVSVDPVTSGSYMTVPEVFVVNGKGLRSLVLDPDFASNGWFYVYYNTAEHLRLSRFQHLGDTGNPASETIVWEHTEPVSAGHDGGGLDFGPDGRIYLAVGDGFLADNAQDLTTIEGSLLRMNVDGSAPFDNPFVDGPGGNRDLIWAHGLRNPYKAHWDLESERLYIADVGGNVQETAREDVHLGHAGGNYGWPLCEGSCGNPDYPACDCDDFDDPVFSYPHDGNGASITGGFVYRGNQFPAEYVGRYFYADWVRGWIRTLAFDGGGVVSADDEFETTAGQVLHLEEGPNGDIYYTTDAGELRRITYADGNQAPVIISVDADVTVGPAPLTVMFTGVADDAESDPLTYEWFFGDGAEATGAVAVHEYTANGYYGVTLEVSDATHTTTSQTIFIAVGAPPVATIETPLDGDLFRAGDIIAFSGTADDPDGSLTDDDLEWTVVFNHNEHHHPVIDDLFGPGGSFEIPTSGHDYSDDTSYTITLKVIDDDGIPDETSVTVYPDKVDLTFDTNPSGLLVYVDGAPRPTPFVLDTLIDFQHTIAVTELFCQGGVTHQFSAWSDGGAATHDIVVPITDATLIADYLVGPSCDTTPFLRGDANGDGELAFLDPLFILAYQFTGGPQPGCLNAADVDDDGVLGLSDPLLALGYMFLNGPPPPAPFPACGPDYTDGANPGCATEPACL